MSTPLIILASTSSSYRNGTVTFLNKEFTGREIARKYVSATEFLSRIGKASPIAYIILLGHKPDPFDMIRMSPPCLKYDGPDFGCIAFPTLNLKPCPDISDVICSREDAIPAAGQTARENKQHPRTTKIR